MSAESQMYDRIMEEVIGVSWASTHAAHEKLSDIILEYVRGLYELQEVPLAQRRPIMMRLEQLVLQVFRRPHVSRAELHHPARAAFLHGCEQAVHELFEREQYFSGDVGSASSWTEHDARE